MGSPTQASSASSARAIGTTFATPSRAATSESTSAGKSGATWTFTSGSVRAGREQASASGSTARTQRRENAFMGGPLNACGRAGAARAGQCNILPVAPQARIALAQVNTTVGDFAGNAAKIRAVTERARAEGATLVVFPELALCGYPPRDFLDLPEFLERAARTLAELAAPAAWSRDVALVVGFPEAVAGAPPPGVYNSAALISGGRVVAVGRKSLLPTYDVFDETRYFLPSSTPTAADAESVSVRIGLSVCEDVWNDKRFWLNPRYARDPIAELVTKGGAGLVVNISASPYAMGKPALRERMLAASAAGHGAPIAYVNQVGGNDALVFDGGSMLVGSDGAILARAPLFEEVLLVADLATGAATTIRLDGEKVAIAGGRRRPGGGRGPLRARARRPRLRAEVRVQERGRGALRRHRLRAHRLPRRRRARRRERPRGGDAVPLQLRPLARGRRRARPEPRDPVQGDLDRADARRLPRRSSRPRRASRSAISPSRTCRPASAARS